MTLVVATSNAGKLREFARILGMSAVIRSMADAGFNAEVAEPGPGYVDNALAKAAAVSAALDVPVIADDSGIEIDALHGWPGPRSARWLGPAANDEERVLALLAEVQRRSPTNRRARFVCVVALCRPGAEPVTARGESLGTIVTPSGANGFGYDPIFLSDDLGITFASASAEEKDRVSHRARALRCLCGSEAVHGGRGAA
ncbi:MAG: RdgB/HAM1 family non-canonical purine NTP pyrophosphatase [Candidatus Dormibacteraeota bacterium]|uniref:dITP/XTP pyrophosphatase n=1 Tax=Candidatus Amunia macphersoniae TaxID=3127014 RepID=A0A934KNF7_9BACT|nr:RdgB/HAM1 family non-canonical purine NTP pyrophosphatase [Candidatus Dormibacteraeota bacterium]